MKAVAYQITTFLNCVFKGKQIYQTHPEVYDLAPDQVTKCWHQICPLLGMVSSQTFLLSSDHSTTCCYPWAGWAGDHLMTFQPWEMESVRSTEVCLACLSRHWNLQQNCLL